MTRLPQLDTLRGIAVILVLFRHHWVGIDWLQKVGWVGVDLFFVLSGFLVSGLLFSEYKRDGKARPGRFLIRRGFKIYPMFYASILLTLFLSPLPQEQVLAEVFFLQNYLEGFWGHHWSIAVEEHFYLVLALLSAWLAPKRIATVGVLVLIACLVLRVFFDGVAATHVRADSLFFGVLISYVHHFYGLGSIYEQYKRWIWALCPLPFIVASLFNFYDMTPHGFTLIYMGFGALLVGALHSRFELAPLSWVGKYSYGIYLFHLYMIEFVVGRDYFFQKSREFSIWAFVSFLIFFAGSIVLGVTASHLIELPFLKLRDALFPARARGKGAADEPLAAVAG